MLKTFWDRWCRRSITMVWGYFKVFVGIVLVSLHEIFNVIGVIVTDPDVKAAVSQLSPPAWIGLSLAVIGAITLMARSRSFHFSETPDVAS